MEVKIGIQSVPRELVVETDTPADVVEQELTRALADGGHSVFTVAMSKGGKVLVPADKIAYVEFGVPEGRRMGFGNIVLFRRAPGWPPGWLSALLVHLVTTRQWNDIAKGRVIQLAAV